MRLAVTGHELDYEVHGDGRTIVFLHGLTLDRAVLRDSLEPGFTGSSGWRRIYLDLPGHGASSSSDPSPGDASLASADGLVAVLAAVLDEVGGARPLIVGHAYGGYLAQGLVAARPALGGVFLVCPVVEPDFAARRLPAQRHTVVDATLAFEDDDERQLFEGEAALHSRDVLAAFRRVVVPAHTAADRSFVAAVRSRYASSLPLRSAACAFTAPTALVCGRDDYWAGFLDAAQLAGAFPRSSLTVLPDCGTLLPIEAPDRLQEEFLNWLDRCAAG